MPEVVPARPRCSPVCMVCPPGRQHLHRAAATTPTRGRLGRPHAASVGQELRAAVRASNPIRASRRANVESQPSGGPRAWHSWSITCPHRLRETMKRFPTRLFALVLAALSLASLALQASADDRQTFVLVHGATAGGWEWKRTGEFLTADGHTVYRATLTGLGEREHLNSPEIDLETHIQDVVNLILFEDLHDVVLTGHSYGGMVVTGVMDRIPERLKHVVFLDAAVPEDGQSLWDLFGGQGMDPDRFKDGFMQVP